MFGSGTPLEWAVFLTIIVAMLALDLAVFNRRAHHIKLREAAGWSIVWVLISLAFNLYVWKDHGADAAAKFFTAYIVEKSLSVDNLFVFLAVFTYFQIPSAHQHRVLFWGVIGALVLRALFIGAGTALILKFHWMMYVFGAFLIYTGAKLGFLRGVTVEPGKSPIMRLATRYLRFTKELHGSKFFVRHNGLRMATPLFLVLLVIEFTDVLFAFDSVPAVLGISQDPFIVYSSNIFAILGLRALYFLLAGAMYRLRFLDVGLAAVLVFIGLKMVAGPWVHISTLVSLGVITSILTATTVASLLFPEKGEKKVRL